MAVAEKGTCGKKEGSRGTKLDGAKERKGRSDIEIGRIFNIDILAIYSWAPRVLSNLLKNSNSK